MKNDKKEINFYTLVIFRNNELYEKRVYRKIIKTKNRINPLQGF
jgi:hypothetical protein